MSLRWDTAEAVRNDLAQVTGVRSTDFDNRYMIRGQKPPPPPQYIAEEDEEIITRFGNAALRDTVGERRATPDLHGITKMLRMVEKLNDATTKENLDTVNVQPTKIVVSKLNPHVKEFVPKTCNDIKDVNGSASPSSDCKQKLEVIKDSIKETCSDSAMSPDINKNKQKMEALKEKIKESSKVNTLKEKKERNVAIAALMKLNCIPAAQVPSTDVLPKPDTEINNLPSNPQKIKLFTPDYFTSKVPPLTQQETNDAEPSISKSPTETLPSASKSFNEAVASASKSSNEPENLTLIYDPESGISSRSLILERDPLVAESTKKVNGWFEGIEGVDSKINSKNSVSKKVVEKVSKAKQEIGPPVSSIVYIAKDISSVSNSTAESSKPKKQMGPPAFVPSKRASDLAKKYEERGKALAIQKQDLWERVETELKARDKILKQRLEQNETS